MNAFLSSSRGKVAVLLIVVAVLGAGAWYTTSVRTPIALAVQEGDSVSVWSWEGVYKDGGSLETRAKDEIARLEALIGTGEYPDYQLYIGIAQQYELLGEGKKAYEYLNKALAIDSTTTGLAWHNLGVLFVRFGAFNTARVAYAKAVEAQPEIMQFHIARLTFLAQNFKEDAASIEGAFAEAQAEFGDAAQVLQVKAEWLASTGKTAAAIAAWKTARTLLPANMHASVDAEIARLQAKL